MLLYWKKEILIQRGDVQLNLSVEFWSRLCLSGVVVYVHTRQGCFGGQRFSYSFVLEKRNETL